MVVFATILELRSARVVAVAVGGAWGDEVWCCPAHRIRGTEYFGLFEIAFSLVKFLIKWMRANRYESFFSLRAPTCTLFRTVLTYCMVLPTGLQGVLEWSYHVEALSR